MDSKDIVCYCSNVTKEQILSALANGGETMEDVRRMTSACTLGKCKELSPRKKCCSSVIIKIIEEYNKKEKV